MKRNEVYYIMVGLARSGNTFLHLGVAEHPLVSACIDEVDVVPFFTQGVSTFTKGNELSSEKENSHLALFKCLATLTDKQKSLAYGMHTVIANSEDSRDFVRQIQANYPSVKIILVKRLNLIARLASLKHAADTGVYTSFQNISVKSKMTIRRKELTDSIRSSLESMEILEQLKATHDVMDCIYEYDIENKNIDILNKVIDYIQVPSADITWGLTRKIAPDPYLFIADYAKQLRRAISIVDSYDSDSSYRKEVIKYLKRELHKHGGWSPKSILRLVSR